MLMSFIRSTKGDPHACDDTINKLNKPNRNDLITIEELKPCPFCNHGAIIHADTSEKYKSKYYIKCSNCGLETELVSTNLTYTPLMAIKDAVLLWNNRIEDDTGNQGDET